MRRKRLIHKKLGVILAALIVGTSLFAGCRGDKTPSPDTTQTSSQTTESTETTQQGTAETTDSGDTTEPTTAGTEPTGGTDKKEDLLSQEDAYAALTKKVDPKLYQIESKGEYLADGNDYYEYKITGESESVKSVVLVDRKTGQLYYRLDGVVSELTKFPPDKVQTAPVDTEITKEEALELLNEIPYAKLLLPAELTEYTIQYDDWTTMVGDTECYGINAFADLGERMQLMGVYYVALDGSKIFGIDSETGDFTEIKK